MLAIASARALRVVAASDRAARLVDVMLVLLVIFLVASVYIVKEAIEVDLPSAAKTSDVVETTLSIVHDKSGANGINVDGTESAARAMMATPKLTSSWPTRTTTGPETGARTPRTDHPTRTVTKGGFQPALLL